MSKNILLVDDDPSIRMLVSEYLKSHGHSVSLAETGLECLKKLEAELPQILMLDLQMPGMNGMEVLTHIRASQRLATMKIIMFSANLVEEFPDLQVDAFLQKPFSLKELLELIE